MLCYSRKLHSRIWRIKYHKAEFAEGNSYRTDGSSYDLEIFVDDRRVVFRLGRSEVLNLANRLDDFLKTTQQQKVFEKAIEDQEAFKKSIRIERLIREANRE